MTKQHCNKAWGIVKGICATLRPCFLSALLACLAPLSALFFDYQNTLANHQYCLPLDSFGLP
ncbi:hypothetical protein [Moraxella nonliquefaciens]|uniref:hypothetical protein n=1 Tax=Moraxella nonliquefaciens TaxID=478 RepID=UPI0012E8714F|nr:hypothetical protein [Moraxella nonliquefaciens]